ncbi:DUF4127 family protein [Sinomicrobium oceani]|uniref:DUF4127 family protein n=1 Tax=Sinomicrobium oceani TaxID=1150368 RepID=UPI00227B5AB0|nr:DUF4127 family protein [Sinomicrobium oceani]
MKYLIIGLMMLCSLMQTGYAQSRAKILLIPLDDRPPCLQFPETAGRIAGYDLVSPPREWLGRYTRAGDPDKIIEWMEKQDLSGYDALIISADMLAYGGLVASREHRVSGKVAARRLSVLHRLRNRYPDVPVYLNSVIMRLAPTATAENEAYRRQLQAWAEQPDPDKKPDGRVPSKVIGDYVKSRKRNNRINRKALELVEDGVVDYLILSQDDAHPSGMHIREREALKQRVHDKRLEQKVHIQPGADEIGMVLLARYLSGKSEQPVRVDVLYSSAEDSKTVMPFEDKPLDGVVEDYIATCGGQKAATSGTEDLLLMVYTSRGKEAETRIFTETLKARVRKGYKVILADIDPKGNVQGGSRILGEYLVHENILDKLYAYASWNTSGNTLGTAIAQGYIYRYAETTGNTVAQGNEAQRWFLWHRWSNDFLYNNIIRKQLLPKLDTSLHWSSVMTAPKVRALETEGVKHMHDYIEKLQRETGTYIPITKLQLLLPWNRLFEAHVDYTLQPE